MIQIQFFTHLEIQGQSLLHNVPQNKFQVNFKNQLNIIIKP